MKLVVITGMPDDWKLETPFLQTVYTMEVESGRLIQTRIRLFK